MKTPREILFERHRPAEAKLDAVRENALASIGQERRVDSQVRANALKTNSRTRAFIPQLWRELFQPKPKTWAGLAAVWVLIFTLKLSTHDESHVAGKTSPVPPEVVAEVRQQRLFFSELIGAVDSSDGEPPKLFSPRPRSEGRHDTLKA